MTGAVDSARRYIDWESGEVRLAERLPDEQREQLKEVIEHD